MILHAFRKTVAINLSSPHQCACISSLSCKSVPASRHACGNVSQSNSCHCLSTPCYSSCLVSMSTSLGVDAVQCLLVHTDHLVPAPISQTATPPLCWKRDISALHHIFSCLAGRYGGEHKAKELQKEAVYGLTELHRDEVKSARLVANPGCYPTSVQLPLVPLLKVHTRTALYSPICFCLHVFVCVVIMIFDLAKHKDSSDFSNAKSRLIYSLLDNLPRWLNWLWQSQKLHLFPLQKHQSWQINGRAPSWCMLKSTSRLYSACLSL